MNILDTLLKEGAISKKDLEAIQKEVRESGDSLERVLERRGIDTSRMLAAKADAHKVPSKNIGDNTVAYETLKYIPEESARHYRFVPLGVVDGVLEVGLTDPDNIDALDALNFISTTAGIPYKVFLISEEDFEKVLSMYKGLSSEVDKALTDLESELSEDVELAQKGVKTEEKESRESERDRNEKVLREDAPVTKIVATILRYAVEGKASDVHVEPSEDKVRVRFRVDGILNTSLVLPIKVHRSVVARVKILSSMRLDEKRKPQDGRFSARVLDRNIDFRVSTFPTSYGEKVVMRILDTEKGVLPLEELGLSGNNLEILKEALQRPYGMVLISGPTGSGKTTTLYSMLNIVDRERKNVLSLEDPVEYNIPGVSQSQVRPEIGYTFANGLRTTLRQDPNIIMVGEIRDGETAKLAVQAALTGHLVLSTIHTNNAIGVIPRLIDMGVDPYLIPPTLILAMAQRLVRTLCPGAGKPVPVEGSVKLMLNKQFEDLPEEYRSKLTIGKALHEVESTPDCPNGTRGRLGVFEMLPIDSDIERVVLEDPSEARLYDVARKKGMLTMQEDAIMKSFDKVIPFSEVNTLGKELLSDEDAAESQIQAVKRP